MFTLRKCVNVLKWFYTHKPYIIIWYLKESVKYLNTLRFITEWGSWEKELGSSFPLWKQVQSVVFDNGEDSAFKRLRFEEGSSGKFESADNRKVSSTKNMDITAPVWVLISPHALLLSPPDLLSSYPHVWAPEDMAGIVQKTDTLCIWIIFLYFTNHRTASRTSSWKNI